MRYETEHFRHAEKVLEGRDPWLDLLRVITSIKEEDIEAIQRDELRLSPVGAQTALNRLFRRKLGNLRRPWESGARVFPTRDELRREGRENESFPRREIDFLKEHVGVEVVFNNASYLERTILRLNQANDSEAAAPSRSIFAGVIVVASEELKDWGTMDKSVETYQLARESIHFFRGSFSVPLMLVGLFPGKSWAAKSTAFGTGRK